MSIFSSKKKTETAVSSSFSEFIRNAPSKEKKRVYSDALKKASEMQNDMVKRTHAAGNK